jgi:hypothetical protein
VEGGDDGTSCSREGMLEKKASRFGQTVANFGRDWKKKKMAEEGVAAGLERRARLGRQELAW